MRAALSRLTIPALAASTACAGMVALPAIATADEAPTAPKNVIVLIGDGMGYNQVDIASLYENGTAYNQVTVDPSTGERTREPGTASQVYEEFDVQIAMEHNAANTRVYDPESAWGEFAWVASSVTDSAAAGTALATGVKTNNGMLGVDPDGDSLVNLTEYAIEAGKATGVVSSVPFSHATPSAYVVHNADRDDMDGIAHEMVESELDVIIGGGHPFYDDSHETVATPSYGWISEADWSRVSAGETAWSFLEENADFDALADGSAVPDRVFGVPQVGSTLQQGRAGDSEGTLPWEVERNDVPELRTLARGALNVLDQNEEGFFVSIEGGAIDWTGHANQTTRTIEEQLEFNDTVAEVVDWVETESSWEETLVIVTADHETGYLAGAGAGPDAGWTPMTGEQGELPEVTWHSGGHTNALVPFYAHGAGAEQFAARADQYDPVRGAYLDNTDVANASFALVGEPVPGQPGEGQIPLQAQVPTVEAGDLTLAISDQSLVEFASTEGGKHQNFGATLPEISVADTRNDAQAADGGWSVSGQSSDLSAVNLVLGADNLGWSPDVLSGRQGVESGPVVNPTLSGGTGIGAPATLATALGESRRGTSVLSADLHLQIEEDSEAGTYQGALTVSLFPVD